MKLLKIFALTVLAAVTFAACSDDECDGTPAPLKIVASQTMIPTLGGDGSVTVNQKVSEAYAKEDWLTVSKAGNVVNVTAVQNNDRESRHAKLVIKSTPMDSVIIAISQYGTIYNAEGCTNIVMGPSTRSYTMPVIHNVETKVKECPSWVSAQIVEDKLLITVADNTGVEPREGLIKVGTVKYTNTIKVMQGANADGLTEIEAGPEGKPAKVAVVKGTQVVEAPEWVDAQIVKDSLVVAVQENTAMESRQGVVKYGTDKYTNTIKVAQDAVVFDLSKVEDNIVVEAEASKVTIPVTYNGTLKVYSCPEWVTATVKADGIELDIPVNKEAERTGEIEFGTSIYKHVVTITQQALSAPIPLAQQFVDGDWFIAAENIGTWGKAYFDYADGKLMETEGEELVYACLCHGNFIRSSYTSDWGFTFYVNSGYAGQLTMNTEVLAEDKVAMQFAMAGQGDGVYYHNNCGFNYYLYVFGYSAARVFTLTADDANDPTVITLTEDANPDNWIVVTSKEATYKPMAAGARKKAASKARNVSSPFVLQSVVK